MTPGKAEKLARSFAATWKEKIKGYVALDDRTFAELAEWYYETIAPSTLKPNILEAYRKDIQNHITPRLGREKLKNITRPCWTPCSATFGKTGTGKKVSG